MSQLAMGESATLWAIFTSSFLAATLLPGGSEAVLYFVLKADPDHYWLALLIATTGNTLGGMSSYLIGRIVPQTRRHVRALAWIERYGAPILLLSWVPVIGDPLCAAAGWLRINALLSCLFMAAGKLARYIVVASFAA